MTTADHRLAYAALIHEKRDAWLRDRIVIWRQMATTCSERIPPTVLLLLAIISIQLGSALATKLFSSLGPFGTAFISTSSSALLISLRSGPGLLREAKTRLSRPDLSLLGCYGLLVALLSTVLPMVLEFRALRRLSARRYGILVTLEPAIAAAIGLIWLGQAIGLRGSLAICCVTVAALGISLTDAAPDESRFSK